MKTAVAFALAALGVFCAPAARAQASATSPAPAAEAAVPVADGTRGGEPNVRRTVVEDGSARIDELRVRGQLQKVTVAPKGNLPGYEILLGDGSRDLSEGAGSARGAAGKRVWNVFRF